MALYSELDSYLLATNAFTTAPANEITSVKNPPPAMRPVLKLLWLQSC